MTNPNKPLTVARLDVGPITIPPTPIYVPNLHEQITHTARALLNHSQGNATMSDINTTAAITNELPAITPAPAPTYASVQRVLEAKHDELYQPVVQSGFAGHKQLDAEIEGEVVFNGQGVVSGKTPTIQSGLASAPTKAYLGNAFAGHTNAPQEERARHIEGIQLDVVGISEAELNQMRQALAKIPNLHELNNPNVSPEMLAQLQADVAEAIAGVPDVAIDSLTMNHQEPVMEHPQVIHRTEIHDPASIVGMEDMVGTTEVAVNAAGTAPAKSSYQKKKEAKKRERNALASPEKLQALAAASQRGEVGHAHLQPRRPAALLSAPAHSGHRHLQNILRQQAEVPRLNIDAESDSEVGRMLDMYTSGDHVITVDNDGATFGSFRTLAGFYLYLQLKKKDDLSLVEQLRRGDSRQVRAIMKNTHLFQREAGHYECVAWALWDYVNRVEHTDLANQLAAWQHDVTCEYLYGQQTDPEGHVTRVGQWVRANQADWWVLAVKSIKAALLATISTGQQHYPDFSKVVALEHQKLQTLMAQRRPQR